LLNAGLFPRLRENLHVPVMIRLAHGAALSLRDQVWQALIDQGWSVPIPQGNFVWLETGDATERAAEVLGSHGIVARALGSDGIRVSIGEAQSVDKLLKASAEVVRDLPSTVSGAQLD
jgi:histidinol-phosphate/aromatic aminotransferase/cobyric acid decarboxylase-like protein